MCLISGASKSWSHNTWKIRAVLNFKGIPYTQSWISYPDIQPLLTSLDVQPNEQGRPYTLPAIIHKSVTSNPNGVMMDSLRIAMHLDNVFPSPPLFPSGDASYALVVAVGKLVSLLEPGFRPFIIPRVADHLDPRGQEYFHKTRSAALEKPLSEVRPTDPESLDKLWKLIETESVPLTEMLKGREGKKGPFFEGEKPGFADLLYASELAFIGRFDKELFEKFMDLKNGENRALYDACLSWLEGQGEDKEWLVPLPNYS
jgi:glutathione S-transferase